MEGRQSVAGISKSMPPPNPITQLQTRFKELETDFKAWLSKQSLPVQATVVTANRAAEGVAERVAEISKFMPPAIPIAHLQTSFNELVTGFKVCLAKQSLPAQATIVTATRAAEGVAERVEEISKYMLSTNPITQLQTGYKEIETGFKAWLADHSLLVEVTTRATILIATGATNIVANVCFIRAIGSYFSSFFSTPPPQAPLNLQAMSPFKLTQDLIWGRLVQDRNYIFAGGVCFAMLLVMVGRRGVLDVQSCMISSFCSGAMFKLLDGARRPADVFIFGLFCSLVEGALYKLLLENKTSPMAEDMYYARTRSLLTSLGLQDYEKNFKKGLLTDITLPMLTERALSEVGIPPGPRLLILECIQSEQAEFRLSPRVAPH